MRDTDIMSLVFDTDGDNMYFKVQNCRAGYWLLGD